MSGKETMDKGDVRPVPEATKGEGSCLEELQRQNAELRQRVEEGQKLIASLTEMNSGLNRLLNRYANGLLKLIDIASGER